MVAVSDQQGFFFKEGLQLLNDGCVSHRFELMHNSVRIGRLGPAIGIGLDVEQIFQSALGVAVNHEHLAQTAQGISHELDAILFGAFQRVFMG